MRVLKQISCLFFLISWQASAQDTDFNQEVSAYLESNGTLEQYQYAYDELLKMLGKQYPKSEKTANGWEYLENNKETAIADIKEGLVPIYQQNFKRDEIKKMLGFYQSTTGKQLVNDRSKMSESQKQELNRFYNTAVGEKIIEKQAVLRVEISKVSESWSRDLYETALSLLKE